MKNYLKYNDWKIWEDKFHTEYNEITESIMSLGNGNFGTRGNFEETYTGRSLAGCYVAGVWFPDKTKVGWWKNGYPEYFAKVINSVNWLGVNIEVKGVKIDLAKVEILDFYRELDLKKGILLRKTTFKIETGETLSIESRRFCSVSETDLAQINFSVTALDFEGEVKLISYLDGNTRNRDSNHDEYFWLEKQKNVYKNTCYLQVETKPNNFGVPTFNIGVAMNNRVMHNQVACENDVQEVISGDLWIGQSFSKNLKSGESLSVIKTVSIKNSNDILPDGLFDEAVKSVNRHLNSSNLLQQHILKWEQIWSRCDVEIQGDISAQIGIRFNIFHLLQTYTGSDSRLNIGPKGFTGEKYGGVTYWDTEAYCIPFYLANKDFSVAKNLLKYRYNHLEKAIKNAEKLGFKDGAALYPMVTMNGEECHNEWEITFEEIHRNGAIAYAIYDYINYTGDTNYLSEGGLEVLIAISRFWAQRVNWSADKNKYVMLGVTGPNEYENNINNNWYTNYFAVWTLKYTLEAIEKVDGNSEIFKKLNFNFLKETEQWKKIIEGMYFPEDDSRGVFLQQDGFLDKELLTVADISDQRPINQKWSWDRILRSCFIKQADVLQGLYFFEDDFDDETHRRNFDFYEPMTVHESSLSPCVHTILACKLGKIEKAYEMYLRTSRLDLDDYNNDTEDGLHITSMAGTWLAVIKGFGGVRVADTKLSVSPHLPDQWESLRFKIGTCEGLQEVYITKQGYEIRSIDSGE